MPTRKVDWKGALATMRGARGEWRLIFRDAPVRRARNLHERAHPDLQGVTEVIDYRVLHSYVGDDGIRRGDIWGRIPDLTAPQKGAKLTLEEGE